ACSARSQAKRPRPRPTARRRRPRTSTSCGVKWPWMSSLRPRSRSLLVVGAMIYQRHVSDKQRSRAALPQSVLLDLADEGRDQVGAERPVVVEIGDDLLHERLRQPDRALLVAEVLVEDRERELLRAFALVGPFEAILREALNLVVLV